MNVILLSSGSELQLALAAAKLLVPALGSCRFPRSRSSTGSPSEYRESILPGSCRRRVAIEAGVTALWRKYVGLDGRVVGIDRFGLSAPSQVIYKELGITAEAVVAAVGSLGA